MITAKFRPGDSVTWDMANRQVHCPINNSNYPGGIAHADTSFIPPWTIDETITLSESMRRRGSKGSPDRDINICVIRMQNGKSKEIPEEFLVPYAKDEMV